MNVDPCPGSRMVSISRAGTPIFDRAVSAYKTGKLVEAEQLCQQVVAARPDFFDAICLLAQVQSTLGKINAALATYDRALEVWPDAAEAHFHRGALFERLQRYNEALASYDRALTIRPHFAAALSNRGNILHLFGRFGEALASYESALQVRPDFAMAHYNRGRLLQDLNRQHEALASYDRALELRPDFAAALCNRGNVLQALGRCADSLTSYDRAVELRPDFAEAFSNRGAALHELQRFDEALASYGGAIAVWPDYADAHFNEAICRLLFGDFARGWNKFEWRSQGQQLRHAKRDFAQPKWLGEDEIEGKTIFLYAEQGFGDTIQFCRYVPLVAKRGARVVLEVQDSLKELMTSLDGTAEVVAAGSALPDFDVQCPLLSLPLAFGTRLETIPSAVPYLRAASSRVIDWDVRLGPKKCRPRIGLAWSGSPIHLDDRKRSIQLRALLSLFDIDATFVSLQKDVRPEDATVLEAQGGLLDFGNALINFSETAALIANLDLVICVDTSVAHLAGALGKTVWLLLPFTPDWRWLLERVDSPWYPTARLFRQDDTRAWDNVIAQVKDELRKFVQAHEALFNLCDSHGHEFGAAPNRASSHRAVVPER